ncbi:hypothetical protein ACJMK2_037100 [Sinanodonta woodiana]|uniref:Uncharacterized protein n=1 Tax=Sinanodonta woodiana TaxID=1069815 RepID=A0ABD3WL10_SINWO
MRTINLIGNRSVTIDKEVIATAVRLSIKSSSPAYTLSMKLIPGLCWCKTNNLMALYDTEINEAITERVSYARKLVKKSLHKLI